MKMHAVYSCKSCYSTLKGIAKKEALNEPAFFSLTAEQTRANMAYEQKVCKILSMLLFIFLDMITSLSFFSL